MPVRPKVTIIESKTSTLLTGSTLRLKQLHRMHIPIKKNAKFEDELRLVKLTKNLTTEIKLERGRHTWRKVLFQYLCVKKGNFSSFLE